ncbi:NACHT domain-containing protein [Kitasatospora sp. MAA4]|uniref:NACHT domain-containing protein n=1 Tax=Kitasatospora sp. MAA4 TaxID=3035093 RepID=UPI00247474CF|nr:NACHT domain-containing protein [Kitasatospora sp. MAA4]
MTAENQAALTELSGTMAALRLEQRLSVEALQRRAQLGRTTVSQALNGSAIPSKDTVRRLAQALHTNPAPLLALQRKASPAKSPVAPQDLEFSTRYRSYLVGRHGQLDIIGLDLSRPERTNWPLDAAYLSLELAEDSRGERYGAGQLDSLNGLTGRVRRAEQALAGRRRVLIRGHAGSGKTTLLQWLAVAAASDQLPDELSDLRGHVPFVLPLRTLIRLDSLPSSPEQLLRALDCPIADAQPPGWSDRALAAGRALVLIDGLDEVSQSARERTHRWLRDLLAAYPRAFYAVTTRPSAVREGWLAADGFGELAVRPMSSRDIGVFVTRWHAAARADAATAEESARLTALEDQLKDTVRAQRDLAQLVTTPLLCALVCALHRDRRGHLPHGRMELYSAALSMLMVRRDHERDIQAPEGIALGEQQTVQLVQRLAWWMIRNGQAEIDRADAEQQIADALPAMPAVAAQGDAAQVLDHLVARCGLLRQPTTDTIDFIHRTFQDHLGAKAAVETRDFGLLDRHATDDQWEDVLRMAVAHARPDEGARIIQKLITRGDRVAKHRPRLHLLAAACVQYATELDPAVRAQVEERVTKLLPPRSVREAIALAEQGAFVLDLLPGPEDLEGDELEAVVHTAARIGGEAALPFLKRFRTRTEEAVWNTLGQGWSWSPFDPAEYAREILAHCPGDGRVTVNSPEQLAELPGGEKFPSVTFDGPFTAQELATTPDIDGRFSVTVQNNTSIHDLAFALRFPWLMSLTLDCPQLTDITLLAGLSLMDLSLEIAPGVDLGVLSELTDLKTLSLAMPLRYRDLSELPAPCGLTNLYLSHRALEDTSARGISRWDQLRSLYVPATALPEVGSELTALKNLDRLSLLGPSDLRLNPLPSVTEVFLGNFMTGLDLGPLVSSFPGLRKLALFGLNGQSVDIAPLATIDGLTISALGHIRIEGADHIPADRLTRRL